MWQVFLSRAVETWPALASPTLVAASNNADSSRDNTENMPINMSNTISSTPLKDIVTSTAVSLANITGVTVNIPPADSGKYVLDGEVITLENILTAADIRACLPEEAQTSHTVHSPSTTTLRSIMTAVWDYLTDLDVEGFFAAPVSNPYL